MKLFLLATCLVMVSSGEQPRRTDRRFVDTTLPANPSQSYSAEQWNQQVLQHVDLSNFDRMRQQVQNQLNEYGVNPRQVPRNDGTNLVLSLDSFSGICDTVLTLYTLGHPLHSGNLFCPEFNRQTREAIQRNVPVSDYQYVLDYALINQTYYNRRTTVSGPLYRGVNVDFNLSTGSVFRFNQFTSASENEGVAEDFLQPGGTLFEIRGARGVRMSGVSQFSTEQEFLIHPFEEFNVYSVS